MSTAPLRTSSAARSGEIICRSVTIVLPFALVGPAWAVDIFEQREESRRVGIGDAVEHRLRFSPRDDQAIFTHFG
jgi:hypothetical protein